MSRKKEKITPKPTKELETEIIALIRTEKDQAKQSMLENVYYNNLRYTKTKKKLELLGKIIKAMIFVDRNFFTAKEEQHSYQDEPLPIGRGQTISQPTTVARMLLLSNIEKGMNVLEIGSGSGWNASLIAFIVFPGKVSSIERIKDLHKNAKNNFSSLMVNLKSTSKKQKIKLNVEFIFDDALNKKGKHWKNKYDCIIATAGASKDLIQGMTEIGEKLLKKNSLLLYPTNEFGSYGALELWQLKKGKLEKILREDGYAFVPLLKGK